MSRNGWLRLILVLWVVGYLAVACGPALLADGVGGFVIGGIFGLLAGSVLFVPWIVGVVILGVLVYLTNPARDRYPPDGRSQR